MSFESLGLRAELLRAVSEKGYSAPTPIQQQAIPPILEGRDLMGGAQTGTGKTAGFTLPLLQRLMSSGQPAKGRRPVRALVLTPTRELAAQVAESVITYGNTCPYDPPWYLVASESTRKNRNSVKASIFWWQLRDDYWITSARDRLIFQRWISWYSTKPTGCSIWVLFVISARCSHCCPNTNRHYSSQPPSQMKSRNWPMICSSHLP